MAELNNDIIDIDLSPIRKKRFRVDGDNNRILELDTSDFGIIERCEVGFKKLQKLASRADNLEFKIADVDDDLNSENSQLSGFIKSLNEIDAEMRSILDGIFNANVSEVCAPSGTLYDFFNGKLRYEYIMDYLIKLYAENINREYALIQKKMSKHTAKYTKRK